MKKRLYIILTLLTVFALPTQASLSDSIEVVAVEQEDSIAVKVTAYKIETQLTFLMQGLTIRVEQPDTLTLVFPSAPMVRNKVRRHPNEVKAVLATQRKQRETGIDSINRVVRPDVQPLVAALNDTTATISYHGEAIPTRRFRISVDRENAVMTFSFKVRKDLLANYNDCILLGIYSAPQTRGDRPEFAGRKLSGEHAPQPHGLGEGIRGNDVNKRTLLKNVSAIIVKVDEHNGR